MKRHDTTAALLGVCMVAFLGLAGCAPQETATADAQPAQEQKQQLADKPQPEPVVQVEVKTDECLSCHPIEEVEAASSDYTTPEGEAINPHRTVDESADKPHESPDGTPYDCDNCHKAHDNPPSGNVELPKSVNSCYADCHHSSTFQSCSNCHSDK